MFYSKATEYEIAVLSVPCASVPKNAQYAANLINEKEKIIINGGTTFSLIPNYIEQKNITVLTNSSNTGFNSFLENYMKVQKI